MRLLQGSRRLMRLVQRSMGALMFFCVSKETLFLSSDLPIRLLLIVHLTEGEMSRSLACVFCGLLGVFLVLFDAREESRVPNSTFSSVLVLVWSNAPTFSIFFPCLQGYDTRTQARPMISVVLCPAWRKTTTLSIFGVITTFIWIITKSVTLLES